MQTFAAGYATLRPHRLAVGLYAVAGRRRSCAPTGSSSTSTGESTELPELVGRPAPDLLLVNDDDLAYAKIRLDERSLATALAHPRGLPGQPAAGAGPRRGLGHDPRRRDVGARLRGLVLASLPGETDSTLLRDAPRPAAVALQLYVAPEHRDGHPPAPCPRLRELAESAEPGSDAQLQLVGAYAAQQRGGDDAAYLRGLLDGTQVLDGLAVDTDMRWRCSPPSPRAAPATEDRRRRRAGSATTPRPAASAPSRPAPPFPTAEAKADGVAPRRRGDRPAQLGPRGGRPRASRPCTTPSCCGPTSRSTTRLLDAVEGKGSHAIIEVIVRGFYPTALADRALARRDRGLARRPRRTPRRRCVRLVTENRDAVARALRAQQRDADA